MLRDAVLSVSGRLNDEVGGPGYRDFRTFNFNSQFYEMLDPEGPAFERRTLYRTWIRSGRSAMLDTFDCPDPSTATPRRAVTTTPLQALTLLNNSFVLRMCDALAARLERDAGPDLKAQTDRLFRLCYGRAAEPAEQQRAAALIQMVGLPALCRVVLNSNEWLYLE